MTRSAASVAEAWRAFGMRMLPFADSATRELPLSRLLRLSLFQISCGMTAVLLTGTLNRVMIVELGVPAWIVALMVALPLVFAPLRALIGFRSDHHRSALGWRRGPYIWYGSLLQFGGLAIMPFALLILSGDTAQPLPPAVGQAAAALAFLLVGAGMHTTQTAGLALATDLSDEEHRPRVVALLYVMLLAGMLLSSLVIGALLSDFAPVRLIQVVQGAAVVTVVLNVIALWKQEVRRPNAMEARPEAGFLDHWRTFVRGGRASRLLVAIGLGAAAFSMQDVLLEPYGAEILGLSVSATTGLTALWAAGTLAGLALAARQLGRSSNPHRLAGFGALAGVAALSAIVFAAPLHSAWLFAVGAMALGFGAGLFSVGTLVAAMGLASNGLSGLALGAWGAVHATATGVAIALGGALRDVMSRLALDGRLGVGLTDAAAGYQIVYHIEIGLLFAALVALGPLARRAPTGEASPPNRFGLADFPT